MAWLFLTIIFSRTFFCTANQLGFGGSVVSQTKPNVLFVFTDDQDLELGSMEFLPTVRNLIQSQALLRGQHAHNTNNTYVASPGGGYDKFRLSGEEQDYLPHWLGKAGYRTEYIGKLMNQYGVYNYQHPPGGWDHFDGLLDPYTYIYNTPVFSLNGARPVYYAEQHQTDVIRAKAAARLNSLLTSSTKPWFLQVAPTAPHQQFNKTGRYPPIPAVRHENLYPGIKAPRTPNFNPVKQEKPSWLGEISRMNDSQIDFSDRTWRGRAQALKGIDEMVEHLLRILSDAGVLENTVIIFSTDHGYHVGQHRVPAGKSLPYREDTHIPFMIRGPGVPKNLSTLAPSTHVDIAPTILNLVGLPPKDWPVFLDGRDLSTDWQARSPDDTCLTCRDHSGTEVINIEFWGSAVPEGALEIPNGTRNTYKTVRVVGADYGYLYSHWCTNETEMYDTKLDPYEMNPISPADQPSVASRLNALLLATKTCSGNSCRDPWAYLHPQGDVQNLKDALNPKHDQYYASMPKVSFKECLNYQLPSNEAPFSPGFDPLGSEAFARNFRTLTDKLGSAEYPGVDDAEEQILDRHSGAVYVDLEEMEKSARPLTDAELAGGVSKRRALPYYG